MNNLKLYWLPVISLLKNIPFEAENGDTPVYL
jgi:hypothetical protein